MAETGKQRWWRSEHTRPHPDWLKPLPQGPVMFDHSRCTVAGTAMQEATDRRRSPEHRTAA